MSCSGQSMVFIKDRRFDLIWNKIKARKMQSMMVTKLQSWIKPEINLNLLNRIQENTKVSVVCVRK